MMEPSTQAAFPFLEEVRRPISEASPTGQDLSYDEIFLAIKTEIDVEGGFGGQIDYERALKKDGSISTEGKDVDSSSIVERCRTLLLNRSKDLQVACYMTVGLARSEGAKGLAEGLAVINTLLEAFWESLHPEKMKRRQGALQFLANRLKDWIGTQDFQAEAREDLTRAQEEAGALQAFTMDHMEGFQPALSGLQQALEEALRRLPEEEAAPPPQDEAPSEALPAPASSATPGAAPAALASPAAPPASTPAAAPAEPRSPAEAERILLRMATFMREADRTNPVPYRLARVLRWGVLREEPPHTDGRTLLEPSQPQRRDYLRGLLERGEYALLVEAAEGAFLDHPFWLDLQRYLDTAIEALGAPYAPVQADILEETARLVRRFPRLPALAFSDGTPFADEATLMWMETRVQSRLNGREEKGAAGEAPARDGGPPVQARYEEARQHLGHGDLAEALAVMQAGAEGDASARERFLRRFYLARLCMTGRQPTIARSLLERLDDEVARHALDVWEPVLTLEVWRELYGCYRLLMNEQTAEEGQFLQEHKDAMFEKICKLNAAQGLALLQQEQDKTSPIQRV